MPDIKPLTTALVSKHCHVTHRAVLKWIAAGKLKAYRTPGSHARIAPEDFVNFLKTYQFPIPKEFQGLSQLKKVLIVDDDKDTVKTMERILKLQKIYVIEMAFDGFSAGKKFAEFRPDVVLLDIKMPLMDGFGVIKLIREELANNHVKIICVSGGDQQDLDRAIGLGADDALAKPFDHRALLSKLEQAFAGKKNNDCSWRAI